MIKSSLRYILILLCLTLSACDGGDETIPAEVYIVSTFVPTNEEYETTADIWAANVLNCAGWLAQTTHDTQVTADFTTTENSYKLEMRSKSANATVLWNIRIRILDHVSEFDENEKRAAVVDKMCYYLKDEPDYDTDGKWERIALGL